MSANVGNTFLPTRSLSVITGASCISVQVLASFNGRFSRGFLRTSFAVGVFYSGKN
jgi:hypothetical protein